MALSQLMGDSGPQMSVAPVFGGISLKVTVDMLREVADGLQREAQLRSEICSFLDPSSIPQQHDHALPKTMASPEGPQQVDTTFLKAWKQGHEELRGLLTTYQAMWLSCPYLRADRVAVLFEILSGDMAGF